MLLKRHQPAFFTERRTFGIIEKLIMNQDDKFLQSEGNEWFKRNKDYLDNEAAGKDIVLSMMRQYSINPKKVFEVGCSNGWRLGEIQKIYNAQCTGIDPSEEAILDGQKKYQEVNFFKSTASQIPVENAYDLVIVNYVFHWVSRELLLKSIAEIDRILSDNGYLIIGDFSPDIPQKTKYHHLPEDNVFTYKQSYSDIFTATNIYQLLAKQTFHHDSRVLKDVEGAERGECILLKKSYNKFYI